MSADRLSSQTVSEGDPGLKGAANHKPAGVSDRFYFTGFALVVALLIFCSFAPTFFLHGLYHKLAPPPYIIFHGALMTGWVLLLATQSILISMGRFSWHVKLGYVGLIYAALLVPVGCIAVTISAAREVHGHTDFMLSELNVLGISLMQMFLFGGFVGTAGLYRSRPDYHKRLMVLAMLSVLPNAVVRLIPILSFIQTNLDIINTWAVFALAVVAIDAVRLRRLHPVFGFGGGFAAVAMYAAWLISRTQPWDQFWIHSLT